MIQPWLTAFGFPFDEVLIVLQLSVAAGAHIMKFNLTAVAVNYYSLQYERVTGLNQSFAAGFGISPNVSLPFKQSLPAEFGNNSDARTAIESMKFTKFTFTLE